MTAGKIKTHRSFLRDVERVAALLPNVHLQNLGTIVHGPHRYPMLCVEYKTPTKVEGDGIPILISGGVHGDEPAGVYAALQFLRETAPGLDGNFHFFVLPCVNPSGYETDTLESVSGANLNRCFGCGSNEHEVRIIESWLAEIQVRFRLTFDFHEAAPTYIGEGFVESDNPTGTWLYETVIDGSPRLGRQMIEALPDDFEVCRWPTVYQDINDGGVIHYPEGCRNAIYAEETSLDACLNGRWTGHSFTTETPTGWPVERRIQTHLIYISTALQAISRTSVQSSRHSNLARRGS